MQITSKQQLLLIDDDPAVGSSIRLLFGKEFDLQTATSGSEGLRLFEEAKPALVILDLRLPDQHGLDILREIRRIDGSVPVLVLTGYATQAVVDESRRLGALMCLSKPFDAVHLRRQVRDTLSRDEVHSVLLQNMNKRLEELEVFQTASSLFLHDVANPMTSLSALASIIQQQAEHEPEEVMRNLPEIGKLMLDNVGYLASLIEQWRAFSEPSSLTAEQTGLKQVAQMALELIRARAKDAGVAVTMRVLNPGAMISLNRYAVARVLANLLQNAIEASNMGKKPVEFVVREYEGLAEFVVRDKGCGISPDQIALIFKPRYTTKELGMGLGLYISKRIVEGMRGSIRVRSSVGEGSEFTVSLPIIS